MSGATSDIIQEPKDLLGIVVQPLDLHLVNVGAIPTGPTHGEGRLQPRPGDVLKSTPNVQKNPRSGLNLEGRVSDPQFFTGARIAGIRVEEPFLQLLMWGATMAWQAGKPRWERLYLKIFE